MKFSLADQAAGYAIRSYSDQGIMVNDTLYRNNLLLLPDRLIEKWGKERPEDLAASDFEQILELSPDLVLLGTGEKQLFPAPGLYQSLIAAGIGLEVMTTPAACRTYNILMSEGRRVAAALIVSPPASTV
jgi:uncharacterized protein